MLLYFYAIIFVIGAILMLFYLLLSLVLSIFGQTLKQNYYDKTRVFGNEFAVWFKMPVFE